MADLSAFPITIRWPAKHPDQIQLYSATTPNGVKISIALEELGLPYEPHLINISKDESWTPEFLSLNPNGKIPAIIDPNGPDGKPIGLFESGAILLYLADKTGKLAPSDPARRYETIQWVFFQMAFIGPMFGQVGFFHKFAGRAINRSYQRPTFGKSLNSTLWRGWRQAQPRMAKSATDSASATNSRSASRRSSTP